jgi:hypothetical protein
VAHLGYNRKNYLRPMHLTSMSSNFLARIAYYQISRAIRRSPRWGAKPWSAAVPDGVNAQFEPSRFEIVGCHPGSDRCAICAASARGSGLPTQAGFWGPGLFATAECRSPVVEVPALGKGKDSAGRDRLKCSHTFARGVWDVESAAHARLARNFQAGNVKCRFHHRYGSAI